jgi:hypothetical protein
MVVPPNKQSDRTGGHALITILYPENLIKFPTPPHHPGMIFFWLMSLVQFPFHRVFHFSIKTATLSLAVRGGVVHLTT